MIPCLLVMQVRFPEVLCVAVLWFSERCGEGEHGYVCCECEMFRFCGLVPSMVSVLIVEMIPFPVEFRLLHLGGILLGFACVVPHGLEFR